MKNFTIIGLRLIGIWFFIEALSYLQFFPMYLTSRPDNFNGAALGMLIVFLVYLLTAAILFFKAPAAAEQIGGHLEETTIQIVNYEKMAAILFASVGILLFFSGIESFFTSIGRVYKDQVVNPGQSYPLLRSIGFLLVGGGIQLLIGVSLFLGGQRLADWWHGFRNWT